MNRPEIKSSTRLSRRQATGTQSSAQPINPVSDQVGDKVSNSVSNSVNNLVNNLVSNSVSNSVNNSVDKQVGNQIGKRVAMGPGNGQRRRVLPRGWMTLLVLLASVFMTGCGDKLQWYVVSPFTPAGQANLKFMTGGLKYTLLLSMTAIVISVFIGLLVALPGLSKNIFARSFNRVYVEVVRAVPLLVLILWVYYGLPIMMGLAINVFWAGVIALALSDSAFEAEIFRAGIQSIDKGQLEASDSLGLGYVDRMRYVVLPQAIRRVLPPLGNQLVYMLKMSSLVSVIGMEDLTRRANELVTAEYRPLETYTVLILEYLVLILVVSAGVRWLERRLTIRDAR